MTANEFFIRYQDYEIKTKKTGTILSRLSLIRCHLLKAYGDYELADICESNMILLKNKMQAAGLKEGTINTAFYSFSSFFKLAIEDNLINSTPVNYYALFASAKNPVEIEETSAPKVETGPKQPRYLLKLETDAQKSKEPADLPSTVVHSYPSAPFLTSFSPFEIVARQCIQELSERSVVPVNYRRSYILTFEKYVFPLIGNMPVNSVLESDVKAVISYENIPACIGFQRYRIFLMIASIFRYSMAHNLILFNPCSNIRCFYQQPCKPYREFSQSECNALLDAFQAARFKKVILFSFLTGIPIPEALMLSRNNVDLYSGKAVISQRMVVNGPHDSFPRPIKERTISLPEDGISILRDIHLPADEIYFFNSEKDSANTASMNMDLQEIRHHSGISDFSYRDLTENFIMRCLKADVDIASLENYFGYRVGSIITRIYVNTAGILPDSIWASYRKKRR